MDLVITRTSLGQSRVCSVLQFLTLRGNRFVFYDLNGHRVDRRFLVWFCFVFFVWGYGVFCLVGGFLFVCFWLGTVPAMQV